MSGVPAMRKALTILLCLSLLLALGACGKKSEAPAETPAPAPAQTPAPATPTPAPAKPASGTDLPQQPLPASGSDLPYTAPPASSTDLEPDSGDPYPIIVPVGYSVNADLDLDGTEETVLVDVQDGEDGEPRVILKVNGVDYSDILYGDPDIQLESPDTFFYAITDLYDGDPCLEIAIQDWGYSDDYYTNFFRYYEGGGAYSIHGVPGIIRTTWGKGDISFDGNGNIYTAMRLSVLQTWYGDAVYVLNNAEFLELEPQDIYQASRPTDVTLMTPLLGYESRGGKSSPVEAGTQLTVVSTDNKAWVCCTTGSGDKEIWFRLDPANPFTIESPDGFVAAWDALDGLVFAD